MGRETGGTELGDHQHGNAPSCGYRPLWPLSATTLLEYAGAALGITGWFGVRQIGSIEAQQIGFVIWIASGLILIAWGYYTKARGIMLINGVNTVMAASALLALA